MKTVLHKTECSTSSIPQQLLIGCHRQPVFYLSGKTEMCMHTIQNILQTKVVPGDCGFPGHHRGRLAWHAWLLCIQETLGIILTFASVM